MHCIPIKRREINYLSWNKIKTRVSSMMTLKMARNWFYFVEYHLYCYKCITFINICMQYSISLNVLYFRSLIRKYIIKYLVEQFEHNNWNMCSKIIFNIICPVYLASTITMIIAYYLLNGYFIFSRVHNWFEYFYIRIIFVKYKYRLINIVAMEGNENGRVQTSPESNIYYDFCKSILNVPVNETPGLKGRCVNYPNNTI